MFTEEHFGLNLFGALVNDIKKTPKRILNKLKGSIKKLMKS